MVHGDIRVLYAPASDVFTKIWIPFALLGTKKLEPLIQKLEALDHDSFFEFSRTAADFLGCYFLAAVSHCFRHSHFVAKHTKAWSFSE